ncbi:substrate-binding domain-containing protein [Microbacterium sp. YY-01]|uniref:substrate-binding domain-containing protein n=1 Tax=Microbacterium sp. YY-01 TaxID=3421634 RepID=UPI003D165347
MAVVIEGRLRAAFRDPVTTATMDGLTEGLARVGAGVLLLRDDHQHPDAPSLATAPIDAVVLIGCNGRMRAALDQVRARHLPVVVIEGDAGDDIPRIELDNYEAAALIARHVADLGHDDVATVTLPFDSDRVRGDASAQRQASIEVDVTRDRLTGVHEVFPASRVVSTAASSIDEGVLAGRLLLEGPVRPTAILAQSDLLAAGIIRAAAELGVRVPEDVSVTGFDGIAIDGLEGRVLTTAVQPAAEKGRAAGETIARMLEGEAVASRRFTSQFRAGSTTAAPATRARQAR